MPTPTYTALATRTLTGTASSVTFSSIPATYRDLILVLNYGETSATGNILLRYNSDSGSNYSEVAMRGASGGASSFGGTYTQHFLNAANTRVSGISNNTMVQIMDYSATDKHKTALSRINFGQNDVLAYSYRWSNTSAITSFQVIHSGSTFIVGSSFDLYGIVA
jgi:hypothetical protein